MKRPVAFAAVCLALFLGQEVGAGLIQVGSIYTVTGVDFPTDFTQAVTLDQTTKSINGGQLNLTVTVTPDGSNAERVEFNFISGSNAPAGGSQQIWKPSGRFLNVSASCLAAPTMNPSIKPAITK